MKHHICLRHTDLNYSRDKSFQNDGQITEWWAAAVTEWQLKYSSIAGKPASQPHD
jgi:hypothetical protein